jgi:hypothetical protein
MSSASRVIRAASLLAFLFGPVGCPVFSSDDFRKVPASRDAQASGGAEGKLDAGEGARSGSSGSGAAGGTGANGGRAGAGATDGRAQDGGFDPCALCRPKETCCEGACVDLDSDPRNCRQCGNGCPGTTCDSATCTNVCAFGFVDCNRNIADGCEVDAASDAAHCGNCDTACGFEESCIRGRCVCPEATADCDGVAVNGCETDTSSDAANCGGCGTVCGANEICARGLCACASGWADCNKDPMDGCEASLSAGATCGSCALDCGQEGTCVAGACGCKPGYLDCDASVGCETATTEPSHCGSCGAACSLSTPVCNGMSCGVGCGAFTLCGSSCVDTTTDGRNCGGCGKLVGSNQTCVGGKPICGAGFANCDSNPLDCEVDVRSSAAHCGGCSTPCKVGAVCSGGICACAPKTPNDCGTACQQCCSNTQCSDGNSCTSDTCSAGVCTNTAGCGGGAHCCAGQGCFECCGDGDCASGTVCSANRCVSLTCAAPLVLCGLRCVDVETDSGNCSGCGNSCGPGRTCITGACSPAWVTIADAGTFAPREKAAYATLGSKMFVWGGADALGTNLATGATYDASTDAWNGVALTAATPSARVLATAVWTGTYMVVWGGGDAAGTQDRADGARYDPSSNTWLPMSNAGALPPRRAPYGLWTGSRVLFFGGFDKTGKPLGGVSLYDPSNDSWSPSGGGKDQPPPVLDPTLGFSGSLLIVYGGRPNGGGGGGASHDTFTYDPSANEWRKVRDGSDSRYGALGTWDGTALLAWSGSPLTADGRQYSPSSDSWTAVGTSGAPTARFAQARITGWSVRVSGTVALVAGGYGGALSNPVPLIDGALYNTTTNSWVRVPAWPSGSAHLWGAATLAGTEFVVWGGRDTSQGLLTKVGERFRP